MNENIELTIQRLVDNELDEQERAGFLKLADANPELWRQTALAFVEDRVWSSVVSGSSGVSSATTRNGAGTENAGIRRQRTWWHQQGPRILMTAATVLFVLTVALRLDPADRNHAPLSDRQTGVDRQADGEKAESTVPPEKANPPGRRLVSNDEPYRLQMNEDLEVPLFESFSQMRKEMDNVKTGLSPELQRYFQEAGYHVEPEIRYFTGNVQDGRSFIVPVQRYRVRRFGQ